MNDTVFKLDLLKDANSKDSSLLCKRFKKTSFQNINNLCELIKKLPDHDECFFLESSKSFNAFSFVNLIIEERGCIDDLYIATYSINKQFISSLITYLNFNRILNFDLLITDSIRYRMPAIHDLLMSVSANRINFNVKLKWSHKKIICAKVKDDYYVIEGSGNLSDNSAIEQYLFTNCKELYGFRRNF